LRSSDIVNLKFNHIDWETSQITLVQQKTKTPIVSSAELISAVFRKKYYEL
jgi:integrase